MSVSVCLYAICTRIPSEADVDLRSWSEGSCELPDVGDGNWTQVRTLGEQQVLSTAEPSVPIAGF